MKITASVSWVCKDCGEPIGWLGRFLERIFGKLHECKVKRNG